MIEQCVTSVAPLVVPGVKLRMDLEKESGPLSSDRDRMQRVVINLLDDAVKFTRRGSITISLRASGGETVLAVADTGIGIPVEGGRGELW